jgi:streptomycin 6-kinase
MQQAVRTLFGEFDRMFTCYLDRWRLTADGAPIVTRAAHLLPVRRDGEALMLKVATEADERHGGVLLSWWDGDGAARLHARHDDAILLERAEGHGSLGALACNGHDDDATRILCDVVARLHAPRGKPLPELIPLSVWFKDLWSAAEAHGGAYARAAQTARSLLADPQDVGVLHGDIHHDNVLDFGARGWLAIDPKRLIGERAFDYANIFCNPDVGDAACHVARTPERFAARLAIVVASSGLERRRLLQWIVAWSALSAAWFAGDDGDPEIDLAIAELAGAELER